MLLSSGFNVVCRFASQGSIPISCYNSSHRILFLKFGGILKFVKIREFKKIKIRKIRILNLCQEYRVTNIDNQMQIGNTI